MAVVLTPAGIKARIEEVRRLHVLLETKIPAGPDPARDSLFWQVDEWLEDVSGPFDSIASSLWAETAETADTWAGELVRFLGSRGVTARYVFEGGTKGLELPSFKDVSWLVWGLVGLGAVWVLSKVRR